MTKDTAKLPEASRVNIKRRIFTCLEEFPRELELGTFKTEHLLIRLGHLLRELGRHLDKTKAEEIIYGPDSVTLKELGDAYWELGMEIDSHRERNRRKRVHPESVATVERSGL